jgi:hypothetical protein
MRNPIISSPNRPIPLPDCILQDGWWLVEPRGEQRADLHVIAGAKDEGRIDRHHRHYARQDPQLGQGR